jgi:L-fuculose-phosphate aldolase
MAKFVENAAEEVLAAAKELLERGLVEGTSGNISARQADGTIAVTPSSLDYREMELEDIVIINPGGDVVSGTRVRPRRRRSCTWPAWPPSTTSPS